MDPNAALTRARQLVALIQADQDTVRELDTDPNHSESANELAQLFDGLDQWFTRGGFLPAPWAPEPSPTTGEAISPDAALAQLRTAMSVYEDVREHGTPRIGGKVAQSADLMRDAGRALDDWLSQGGMLPVAWSHHRVTGPAECDECEVRAEGVSDGHAESCSLHPANVAE